MNVMMIVIVTNVITIYIIDSGDADGDSGDGWSWM